MSVTPPHVFSGVPHPRIDGSLIDALHGAVAAERMPEAVPALDLFPLAARKRALEVIMGFVASHGARASAIFPAARNAINVTERVGAARVHREPFVHDLTEIR